MKRALVLSLIFAVGLGFAGFAQTLGGSWDTDITIDMTGVLAFPAAITVVSEILVDYTVGDWTFSSETDIKNGTWNNQDFDFAGVLGAFTISGDIEFLPNTPAFQRMDVSVDVSIAGVTFGAAFHLWPNDVYLALSGSGTAGDVTIDVVIGFGDNLDLAAGDNVCDLDFTYLEIDVSFPFCCATVAGELKFDCTGFKQAKFCVEDITIGNMPWLTLGACITFQTGAKTFVFKPAIDLGLIGCDFDLYYHFANAAANNAAWTLDSITIDGIQIACEIGGVSFTGITFFDDFWNNGAGPAGVYKYGYNGWGYYFPGILYGYEGLGTHPGPFFEAYQIATTDDGCCGPFSFDVTVYFDKAGTKLFDVAWFKAAMELQIATQFTFGMGIETDVQANTVNNLTFSFEVTW